MTFDKKHYIMTDESGNSTYSYDERNLLLQINKGGVMQIRYTYDEIGNIETITDKSGATTGYTYDKSSRMETVTYNGTTTYLYDENGNRKAVIYPGGVSEEYSYDKNNRLLTLTNKKPEGSIISSYSYTYDLRGLQETKTDEFGTTVYTYDEAGRIKKVDAPGKTTVYSYDNAGNRQSMMETYTSPQPSGFVEQTSQQQVQFKIKKSEYLYSNTNQLLKLVETMYDEAGVEVLEKTVDYLYDENGNEVSEKTSYISPHTIKMRQSTGANPHGDGVTGELNLLLEKVTNTYDGFNQLKTAVKIKGGERFTVSYVYNGNGLRTKKTVLSSKEGNTPKVTNYLYDRQHVILETDSSDRTLVRYVRGVNYIARIDGSGKTSYFLYNGHGDVVQTVSAAGEVENRYDYDLFGNPILTMEVYANSIRYAGEFFDTETGLYYLRARYYNPYIGRFISEDSYWGEDNNPLSLNLYTYAHNNPIRFVDPSGNKIAMTNEEQINQIISDIDKAKETWWKEEQGAGKGKDTWTEEQNKAHEKANKLREQLAKLESGNKEVEKLVNQKGEDAGTWEGYKKNRKVKEIDKEQKGNNGIVDAYDLYQYKLLETTEKLASKKGRNVLVSLDSEDINDSITKEFGTSFTVTEDNEIIFKNNKTWKSVQSNVEETINKLVSITVNPNEKSLKEAENMTESLKALERATLNRNIDLSKQELNVISYFDPYGAIDYKNHRYDSQSARNWDSTRKLDYVSDFFLAHSGLGSYDWFDRKMSEGYGYGKAIIDFMEWEKESGRLTDSDWWRAVNGQMIDDMIEASKILSNSQNKTSKDYAVQAWLNYMKNPNQDTLWDAHNSSILKGTFDNVHLIMKETEIEQQFASYVVIRVTRLAPALPISTKSPMLDWVVQGERFEYFNYPSTYPAEKGRPSVDYRFWYPFGE